MTQPENASADSAPVLRCLLAGEILRSHGTLHVLARGWSMLPAIWPGDTLVIESLSRAHLRIGDVVVVGRQGRLCAHRVIRAEGDPEGQQWITQGDALPVPDSPVTSDELMGRVAYVIRSGRLIEVQTKLSPAERLVAKIVRRSGSTARALLYLHQKRQASSERAVPCPS